MFQQKWQLHIDTQPVKFFDRELLPHLVYVTRRMAKFVGMIHIFGFHNYDINLLMPTGHYNTSNVSRHLSVCFLSGCDPSDLVLVPNVTTAVNAVLRSFPLSSGDEVMFFSTEYGKCS